MSTLTDIKAAIEDFNHRFPRPELTLSVSDPYDLFTSFFSKYPNADQPGVYILLDEAGTVLRIGKASCGRTLGCRLSDYFKWGDKNTGRGIAKDKAFNAVRYIATIPIPVDRAFEAPAIGEFLLSKSNIRAPLNKVGVPL